VKPDPVSGLKVADWNITSDSATLEWTSPNSDKTILYRVRIHSSADGSDRVSNERQW